MCMITLTPGGVEIPHNGIKNGAQVNNDGHGWAVASHEGLLVGKSMDFEESMDGFLDARAVLGKGSVALFHSRWATHGETSAFNIHPFYVDEAETTVMAHNGILAEKYHPGMFDRRSDTRKFVDSIGHLVDNPKGIPSRRVASALGNEIGGGNKLVFLSIKSGQPKVRIVNVNSGVHTGGVWYSNYGFEEAKWGGWAHGYIGFRNRLDDGDFWEDRYTGKEVVRWNESSTPCPLCGDDGDVDEEYGACWTCYSCLDCYDNWNFCMCYRPKVVVREQEDADGTVVTIGARPTVGQPGGWPNLDND